MSSRKRKIAALAATISMALFTVVYGLAFPSGALAWDDCPRGLVNDPYPGACRRYIDTNDDGICDLSQPKPADTTTTTSLAVTTTTSGEPPTGDCPLGPCTTCGACLGVSTTVVDNSSDASPTTLAAAGGGAAVLAGGDTATTTTTDPSSGGGSDTVPAASLTSATVVRTPTGGFLTHYLVSPIALGFFLIYGASFFLYKKRRIRVATHRKVWNVLLLGTFLVTGIFGVILTIQLDYTLPFAMPIDLLFWHVEAGIAMTFISLFHMGWHFKYYKAVLWNARVKMRVMRGAERQFELDDRRLVLDAREVRRSERDTRRAEREARRIREAADGRSAPAG